MSRTKKKKTTLNRDEEYILKEAKKGSKKSIRRQIKLQIKKQLQTYE